jgi:hypothetical protein
MEQSEDVSLKQGAIFLVYGRRLSDRGSAAVHPQDDCQSAFLLPVNASVSSLFLGKALTLRDKDTWESWLATIPSSRQVKHLSFFFVFTVFFP